MGVDTRPEAAAGQAARAGRGTSLSAALDTCRRHLTLTTLVRRLLLVLAAAALFPLLVVVADHGLPRGLPRPLIFAAGTLWAGATFLTLLLTVVRTLRRRWHRLFIARQLERAWNIAHNALINLVLIEQRPQVAYVRSGAERQASAALAGAEQTGPPPAARLRPQPGCAGRPSCCWARWQSGAYTAR